MFHWMRRCRPGMLPGQFDHTCLQSRIDVPEQRVHCQWRAFVPGCGRILRGMPAFIAAKRGTQ
jgi:hypothetical protein